MKELNKELLNSLVQDRSVRQKVVYESHMMFFLVYFAHYIKYELANFHEEIINITQDSEHRLVCIASFRGSGKSTLVTTSYSLWSILGRQDKKFVLIVCQTQAQAKQHMRNLRSELEENRLLKSDLGPFREEPDLEWAISSLVFSNTGTRITIASLEQSIRGMRHREHRPDLIILDDIEDVQSVKTIESRNKTFDWFTREIIPLGDLNTRIIVVGNVLHEDSLVMRLRDKIENKEIAGIYRQYPLIDQDGICLWPGKFPNNDSLELFRKSIVSDTSWQREYLLLVVPDDYQVIHRDWIQYYDELPKNTGCYFEVIIAIDPAIAQTERSDYTGTVCGLMVTEESGYYKLYILPNPINEKMDFPTLIERIKALAEEIKRNVYTDIVIVVEAIGYQAAILQQLEREGFYNCEAVKPTSDKRSRLAVISHRVKNGDIVFPRQGAEDLLNQIVNFGNERHDDLADAFSMCAQKHSSYTVEFIGFA